RSGDARTQARHVSARARVARPEARRTELTREPSMDILFESPVCRLDEIPDGGAKGLVVPDPDGPPLRVIVLRSGGEVSAYRNRCPHRGTPLDLRPDDFLDRDGRHLVCSTHGALFRREDGYCIAGPCA